MKPRSTKLKPFRFADLFCGGGGTSNGAKEAIRAARYEPEGTHINHNKTCIKTMRQNHPLDRRLCTGVDDVNPRSLYQYGELDLLWASPECTHHSRARGGKPMNEQSRATAHCVTRWAEALLPKRILVENVPEFLDWGPLMKVRRLEKVKWPSLSLAEWKKSHPKHKRKDWMKHCPKTKQLKMCNVWIPNPKFKGQTFLAWKSMLESLGYKVAWKVICCADHGDPTTRQRLFVQAVLSPLKIVWPDRTHAPIEELGEIKARQGTDLPDLFDSTLPKLRPWRSAAECIDWSLEGRYLDEMPGKKQYNGLPLSPKTIARIYNGLLKFGVRPFISGAEGPDVTKKQRCIGRPIIVTIDQQSSPNGTDDVTNPLSTVVTKERHAIAKPSLTPLVIKSRGTSKSHVKAAASPATEPLDTVSTTGKHHSMIEPSLVELHGTNAQQIAGSRKEVNAPLPPVSGQGHFALIDGMIVPTAFGEREGQSPRVKDTTEPMHSVVGSGTHGFAKPELEPLLVETAHGDSGGIRAHRPDGPMKAVCGARGSMSLAQPELVNAFTLGQQSGSVLRPVKEPVPTVATGGAISIIETELGEQIHITVPAGTEIKPFLVKFYNTATGQAVDDPLDTITCKERFALVVPCVEIAGRVFRIRLRWRMLQPHELQLAQGFPRNYKFAGKKTEVVKQIGNAVPRHTARALVYACLTQNPDVSALWEMSFAE